jgi:WhiB family redox-sensing transcriptional regulator
VTGVPAVAPPGATTADRFERSLPCRQADPDLWFAVSPVDLERAKVLCRRCPIRRDCLAAALRRAEPWGVWGGEILDRGSVIPRKRGPGRPRKSELAHTG